MKNIKTFIIGFLSCACLFLIVGATDNDKEIGRYAVTSVTNDKGSWFGVTIIDTKSGEIVKKKRLIPASYTK